MAKTTYRLLDQSEHATVLAGIPVFTALVSGEVAASVLVAEDEAGALLAAWSLLLIPHAEPLWVAEPARHRPRFLVGLFEAMQGLLESAGWRRGAVIVTEEDQVRGILDRLGFQRLGTAHLLPVISVREPVGDEGRATV